MSGYIRKNKLNPKDDVPKHYLEPLIPREAYFGGRVNCTKIRLTCEDTELLFYLDLTSMYPHGICAFDFPIGIPVYGKFLFDIFLSLKSFGETYFDGNDSISCVDLDEC